VLKAEEISIKDDFLINPMSLPYNTEIRKVLQPHLRILQNLALDPDSISSHDYIPVLQYKGRKNEWKNFFGGVTLDDQARINNYMHRQLKNLPKNFHPSIMDLPLAHAWTLLVAHRYHSDFLNMKDCPSNNFIALEKFILDQAWNRLNVYTGLSLDGSVKLEPVDVDMEAIELLDWAMFDRSKEAGLAGNQQWGLDKGGHEDGWNPYNPAGPETDNEIWKGSNFFWLSYNLY
jgi:hypothetical protein